MILLNLYPSVTICSFIWIYLFLSISHIIAYLTIGTLLGVDKIISKIIIIILCIMLTILRHKT